MRHIAAIILIALSAAVLSPSAEALIIITEVMARPPDSVTYRWFEIKNVGPATSTTIRMWANTANTQEEIMEWYATQSRTAGGDTRVMSNFATGEYRVLTNNLGQFNARWDQLPPNTFVGTHGSIGTYSVTSPTPWGGIIVRDTVTGTESLAVFRFDDAIDQTGLSWERLGAFKPSHYATEDIAHPDQWRPSLEYTMGLSSSSGLYGGTPGRINSVTPEPSTWLILGLVAGAGVIAARKKAGKK